MDEQTLQKPINLEGLGTALSALKANMASYVQTIHEPETDTNVNTMLSSLGLNPNVSLTNNAKVGTAQAA